MCYIYNMEGMKVTTKKIKEFKKVPDTSITNEYATSENSLRAPGLTLVIGTRNTGKSYTTAKMLLTRLQHHWKKSEMNGPNL